MPRLRQDPTTRQWVIVAPVRSSRPHLPEPVRRPSVPPHDPSCPFCPGNERQTPPEISRDPDGPEWRVRVVPNKYAALGGNDPTERSGPSLFREMPGAGGHEVVIESPLHDARLDTMPVEEVVRALRAWRARYRELIARPPIRAVVVFKNFGPMAGTSLEHPHSQVVATPVFLPRLLRRLEVATRYFDEEGHCVYDNLVEAEREADLRMVTQTPRFVAFEPFAAGSPFETWVVPTVHASSFGDASDDDLPDLGLVLSRVLGGIRDACGDPDFNLVVYSGPSNGHTEDVFHWHMKIVPKLATPAGFELGSGMSINAVRPEDAALALRGALSARAAARLPAPPDPGRRPEALKPRGQPSPSR